MLAWISIIDDAEASNKQQCSYWSQTRVHMQGHPCSSPLAGLQSMEAVASACGNRCSTHQWLLPWLCAGSALLAPASPARQACLSKSAKLLSTTLPRALAAWGPPEVGAAVHLQLYITL